MNMKDEFILFTWRKLKAGQLIQPSRGRLLRIRERVMPFVYIAAKASWRLA
jgi:hypothetical protein